MRVGRFKGPAACLRTRINMRIVGLALVAILEMVAIASAADHTTWVVANELNRVQSKETTLEEHWKVAPEGALTALLKTGGQTPFYARRTDWPELTDFDLTIKYSYHVPEGVKCKETPLFLVAFRLQGDRFMTFYRGYQYVNFTLWSGKAGLVLANNHIPNPNPDTDYLLRLTVQGRIMKARVWAAGDSEPERWAIEAEAPEILPGKGFALGFKDWEAQKGAELRWKDVRIAPHTGEPLVFLEEKSRPVYLTATPEGRAFVGRKWAEKSIPGCQWPSFKEKRRQEWSADSLPLITPEGAAAPEVKEGRLVLALAETADPKDAKVFWLTGDMERAVGTALTIQGSAGTRPLLYMRAKTKGAADWGPAAWFDPQACRDLAGIRDRGTGALCEYGAAHLLKDGAPIRLWLRFYTGVSFVYGSPEEPCEWLESGVPGMNYNSVCQIGFSGAGKAGTVTVSAIGFNK